MELDRGGPFSSGNFRVSSMYGREPSPGEKCGIPFLKLSRGSGLLVPWFHLRSAGCGTPPRRSAPACHRTRRSGEGSESLVSYSQKVAPHFLFASKKLSTQRVSFFSTRATGQLGIRALCAIFLVTCHMLPDRTNFQIVARACRA